MSADDGRLRCSMCGEFKPAELFAFRNMKAGSRQDHCRRCHAAYRRAHYVANRADYIQRAIVQVRGRRAVNRQEIYDYLLRHPCIDCGERDVLVLEFDHRDPALKWKGVGVLVMTKRWQRVLAEIEKCDVRCVNCHRRRTAAQFGWNKLSGDLE